MSRFAPKIMADGRAVLHLGCGWRMHPAWTNLDFSLAATLVSRRRLAWVLNRVGILSPANFDRISWADRDLVSWDLRKGIPYADGTFDVVYHTQLLDQFDKAGASALLKECRRVLKPRGVIRVAVLDCEKLAQDYLGALAAWDLGHRDALDQHARALEVFLGQSGRTAAKPAAERSFFGALDRFYRRELFTRKTSPQTRYDRRSLGALLKSVGFQEARVENARGSRIAGWSSYGLEFGDDGRELWPNSLYVEAVTERSSI